MAVFKESYKEIKSAPKTLVKLTRKPMNWVAHLRCVGHKKRMKDWVRPYTEKNRLTIAMHIERILIPDKSSAYLKKRRKIRKKRVAGCSYHDTLYI